MIDSTSREQAAMHACLKPFGEAAKEIGYGKSLIKYSEADALKVINAIVTQFVEEMAKPTPIPLRDDDIPF